MSYIPWSPSARSRDHVPHGLPLQEEVDLTCVRTRALLEQLWLLPFQGSQASVHVLDLISRVSVREPFLNVTVIGNVRTNQEIADLICSLGGRLSENGSHFDIFQFSPSLWCARRDLVLGTELCVTCVAVVVVVLGSLTGCGRVAVLASASVPPLPCPRSSRTGDDSFRELHHLLQHCPSDVPSSRLDLTQPSDLRLPGVTLILAVASAFHRWLIEIRRIDLETSTARPSVETVMCWSPRSALPIQVTGPIQRSSSLAWREMGSFTKTCSPNSANSPLLGFPFW